MKTKVYKKMMLHVWSFFYGWSSLIRTEFQEFLTLIFSKIKQILKANTTTKELRSARNNRTIEQFAREWRKFGTKFLFLLKKEEETIRTIDWEFKWFKTISNEIYLGDFHRLVSVCAFNSLTYLLYTFSRHINSCISL